MTQVVHTEERRELIIQLGKLLDHNWGEAGRRSLADGDWTDALKARSFLEEAMELGGILIPAELGGSGASLIDATLVMEELGRTLFPSTYLESWMAVIALLGADADESTTLLRAIASGEAHAAFVWPGDDATWDVDSVPVATVDEEAATGSFSYIPRPSAGAILVVPAQRGAETGLAVVESGSSGDALRATDLVTPDLCRPLVALDLKRAPARFLALTRAPETLTRTIAMGATILAAEMVGAADGALTSSVDYAKARHQFGRPIATFQALKHRMADTLVAVEGARASTFRAASHADDDLSELVHYARIAKTNAGAALYTAAKDCIQIHGGMGFTWDDLSHLFLKKHFSAANLLGASDRLRALIFEYERAAHANA